MTDEVLELRVHGVNNTTPAALLDLPDENVKLVAGDKLGSFWEPRFDAGAEPPEGERGHVPSGIRRIAYSWGGMVRTVPNAGGVSIGGVAAGVLARIGYVIILPFAIGNAVIWTRQLTLPWHSKGTRAWAGLTASLARTFGLVLSRVLAPYARCSDLFDIVVAKPVGKLARRTESRGVIGLYDDTDLLYGALFHRMSK